MINYKEYYENNKESLLKILYDLDYTPHSLVEEASKENMDTFEYIYNLSTLI